MPKVQHIVFLSFKPGADDRAGPLIAAHAGLRQRFGGVTWVTPQARRLACGLGR
jgi:hypothetical protein